MYNPPPPLRFRPLLCLSFVGAENPTYLKEPVDKVVFGLAVGGLVVGTTCIVKGLYDMSYGINKVK